MQGDNRQPAHVGGGRLLDSMHSSTLVADVERDSMHSSTLVAVVDSSTFAAAVER